MKFPPFIYVAFMAAGLSLGQPVVMAAADQTRKELARDPMDGLLLRNDLLGVRIWGPPAQLTLSLGKADIWDRRWFAERQPLITMQQIREWALADPRENTDKYFPHKYRLYDLYDFPCPKPGAQLICLTPFATEAHVEPDGLQGARIVLEGEGKRLTLRVWVSLIRHLVVVEGQGEGLVPKDLRVRVYRHQDTILPGTEVSPTLGGHPSPLDFEPLPPPMATRSDTHWGIIQDFPAEMTFPNGFRAVTSARAIEIAPVVECRQNEQGLGTPLWAPQEGRLDHGIIKRYRPINEATGAAATATFTTLPSSFTILATIATTQDDSDPLAAAKRILDDAAKLGASRLRQEQAGNLEQLQRPKPAVARLNGETIHASHPVILPNLRRPDGHYGDVPLCSVGSTQFCFQDAGLWHDDFHLNEIRAESTLTLGHFEEVYTYARMIHTLLPQAMENARDVYNLPGAMYPLAHFPLRCRGIAHTNVTWEQDMGINGLVSKPLWLYYRYTGDVEFLRETAYPVLRECARFSRAYLSDEQDGRLHIVPTVSPEHWGLTRGFERNRNGASALTLTRYLLRAAAAAAEILDVDREESREWKAAAERLAPYPTYATPDGPVWVDVAGAPPIEYNVCVPLSPVFWGDDVGLDSPPEILELAKRTLAQVNVWPPHRFYLDTYVRPRLGIYRPGATVGPENLLLSYQSIRIFPAVPEDAEIVMEHFRAEGGFRVSATRTVLGEIHDVQIESTLGGMCRVAHPWPGQAVQVAATDGGFRAADSPGSTHVEFMTGRGKTYTLTPRGSGGLVP